MTMNINALQEKIAALAYEINDAMADTNGTPKEMTGETRKQFEAKTQELTQAKSDLQSALQAKTLLESINAPAPGIQIAPTSKNVPVSPAGQPDLTKSFWNTVRSGYRNENYRTQVIADYVAKDYQVQINPRGGYFVTPMQVATEVIDRASKLTYIRALTGHKFQVTGTESIGVVYADDVSDFEWVSEIATVSASTDSPFELRELTPRRLAKLIKISRKLMRHSAVADQTIFNKIVRSKAYTEEKAFISGTGVGQPLGFMTPSDQGVSTSRDVSSGTANQIGFDDIVNAMALVEGGYRGRMVSIAHRNMEARLRKLKDAANQYIWAPVAANVNLANNLAAAMPSSVLGTPFLVSEFMPDPGASGNITTGTRPFAFANFEMGYGIADDLLMEIIPMEETFAASNLMGYTYNSGTDGMPVDQRAFARILVS